MFQNNGFRILLIVSIFLTTPAAVAGASPSQSKQLKQSIPSRKIAASTSTSTQPASDSCTYNTYTEMAPGYQGIQLDTTIRVPINASGCQKPRAGWPMIVTVHGFGGSKMSMDRRAQDYATSGYIAVNFSWRGHGRSTGLFSVLRRDEWEDLRSLTNWLLHTYQQTSTVVNPDRMGIDGIGLGSQISWMAMTQNMGYRDAVPGNFTPYPWDVMITNDCVNNSMQTFFEKQNVHMDPAIQQELWNDFVDLNNVNRLRDFFQSSDRNWTVDLNRVTGHVFAEASWTDAYQFANPALRGYQNDPATPKRVYISADGEEDFLRFDDVISRNLEFRMDWHARWLQDIQNGIERGGPVTYLGYLPGDPQNPDNHVLAIDTPAWPPAGVTDTTLYLRSQGQLTLGRPQSNEGAATITNVLLDPSYTITDAVRNEEPDFSLTYTKIPTSAVTFRSPALEQSVWWLGAPEINYFTSANGPNYNIFALFYDLDPATGQHYLLGHTQSCWLRGIPANRTVQGVSLARRIPAGHVIQVFFQNLDPETSRPSVMGLRMRPYFGNFQANIYYQAGQATNVVLPLKPDNPGQPIFR